MLARAIAPVIRPSLIGSLTFFFFNDTATAEIYTLSLHDALPISVLAQRNDEHVGYRRAGPGVAGPGDLAPAPLPEGALTRDRKSTRLNSSHSSISYAVFCLKKKKIQRDMLTSDPRPVRHTRLLIV